MKKGTKVKIISDNENYTEFLNQVLIITFVSRNTNDHPGYDESLSPEKLFDLKTETGEEVPFSLYEYEVKEI